MEKKVKGLSLTYRDLLVRIDERVLDMQKELIDTCKVVRGHEKRISALENWRNYIVGALAVIGTMTLPFIKNIVNLVFGKE